MHLPVFASTRRSKQYQESSTTTFLTRPVRLSSSLSFCSLAVSKIKSEILRKESHIIHLSFYFFYSADNIYCNIVEIESFQLCERAWHFKKLQKSHRLWFANFSCHDKRTFSGFFLVYLDRNACGFQRFLELCCSTFKYASGFTMFNSYYCSSGRVWFQYFRRHVSLGSLVVARLKIVLQ